MKLKKSFMIYLLLCFAALSICLIIYVLFRYPEPGVADQGDFDRVMSISGLELTDENRQDPNFNRFYDYIVPSYKISEKRIIDVIDKNVACSLSYLIIFINLICKMLDQSIFRTIYLAAAYSVIYICSLCIIIKYINIKSKLLLILMVSLSLFVLFDGNYLIWFNSLYGEPMMITSLLLYISSWIYYIYYKYVFKSSANILPKIIFIFITAFLFLGSKMQAISSLPIIITMLSRLLWKNRFNIKSNQLWALVLVIVLLAIYPLDVNFNNGKIGKDTKFNSVFYGILKESKTPKEDLISMNLNSDMSIEAGKHSYLDSWAYSKYVPHSSLTEKEFYSKINDFKLIKFYLTHPTRLIKGMKYTANHAFSTATTLGHYEKAYSEEPIKKFNRFTKWSSLRSLLPRKLSFILLIYAVSLGLSLYYYIKNNNKEIKAKAELLWSIIFIGLFQFPMPYIGNGEADTSKQLFLFNFVFDILLIVLIYFIIYILTKLKFRDAK